MIRTPALFAALISLAVAAAGCHSKTTAASRSTDYSVISEGSANGVTSTISSPGETTPPLTASTPPLTGTNADTTTAFTIPDTAMQQIPANVGPEPEGAPTAPQAYPPSYSPPRNAPRTPPATSTGGTIVFHGPSVQRPAPRPVPPETTTEPPTDTETTGTSTTTDTTSTQPHSPKKKKTNPPEQPTQTDTTDTTDTGVPTETGTIGHQ